MLVQCNVRRRERSASREKVKEKEKGGKGGEKVNISIMKKVSSQLLPPLPRYI